MTLPTCPECDKPLDKIFIVHEEARSWEQYEFDPETKAFFKAEAGTDGSEESHYECGYCDHIVEDEEIIDFLEERI